MASGSRFSARHGFTAEHPTSLQHETAPAELRLAAIQFAADLSVPPDFLRSTLLDLINVPREPQLWTEPRYVLEETQRQIAKAEWFEIYDFIELITRWFIRNAPAVGERYESKLNRYFERHGIGWKLVGGRIETRGPDAFEAVLADAHAAIDAHGLTAAHRELNEALRDLSRRPEPDLTGAIQHGAAALECVAREITGDANATLGEILVRYPNTVPAPLPQALAKIWGYASESARHVREGTLLTRDETELVVGLCAVVSQYLLSKR